MAPPPPSDGDELWVWTPDAQTNRLSGSIEEVTTQVGRVEAQLGTEIRKGSDEWKESIAAMTTNMDDLAARIDKLEAGGAPVGNESEAKSKGAEIESGRAPRHVILG